jgi:Ca2+-binding RTX toxin-like protein
MPATLTSLITALANDPGLRSNVSAADMQRGLDAAAALNALLLRLIEARGLNADGIISPADLMLIAADVQASPANLQAFLDGHGNDEGNVETGYHLLQNDGGSLVFRGRNFADTVGDAIYHYGFDIIDGRYVNEDGDANETARDVAGWLNYFLNGVSAVFGTDGAEVLHSGTYSEAFALARNERFYGGGGNDSIWADLGNDTVYAGTGNDQRGGGFGNDSLFGQSGNDSLYGDGGNDRLDGGDGHDQMGGGDGNDVLIGGSGNDRADGQAGNDLLIGQTGDDILGGGDGNDYARGDAGNDTLYGDLGADSLYGSDGNDMLGGGAGADWLQGDAGDDRLYADLDNDQVYGGTGNDTIGGGAGNDDLRGGDGNDLVYGDAGDDRIWGETGDDVIHGQAGNDVVNAGTGADTIYGGDGHDGLYGKEGNDVIYAGEGADFLQGGTGRDLLLLWEDIARRDVISFLQGDSGRTLATIDRVEGFDTSRDVIDLRSFGAMTFEEIDFSGSGASAYYDGRFLRIDANGDRATDMMVEFAWIDELSASNFLLA